MKTKLYGTPLSHFTRKIRILLIEFGVGFDFVRVPNLLTTSPETYGENPLLRVPALLDGGETIIESDHIARYLVSKYDPQDRLGVCSVAPAEMNRLALANGIMANEVVLILAARGGLTGLDEIVYFQKLRAGIESGLSSLHERVDPEAGFSYADIAMICMWQHVEHYQIVQNLERYANIASRVERFASRPSIASTTPAASLVA